MAESTGEIRITRLRNRAALANHLTAWEALSRAAAEPNVFYEPWLLLPALEQYAEADQIEFLFVYEGHRLIGFFPVHVRPTFRGLPLRSATLWQHEHCYLCTPLIDKDRVVECVEAFFAFMEKDRTLPRLWTWNWIGAEGKIYQALSAGADARGLQRDSNGFARAIFTRRLETAARHMNEAISGKHRREFGRLEKRLNDMGEYEYAKLAPEATAETAGLWAEEFLELEGSGWKGEHQTALKCKPKDAAFFRESVRAAHARGQLTFIACRLDGKAIGMGCYFTTGGAGFAFKIAYAEELKKYCPGIQLHIWHTGELFSSPLDWFDSCASSNHTMIDRIWPDSRQLDSLTLAHRVVPEGLAVSLIPWAKKVRAFARRSVPGSPAVPVVQPADVT